MMNIGGGGLLTSGRTKEPESDMPSTAPMKPMQPATQQAPASGMPPTQPAPAQQPMPSAPQRPPAGAEPPQEPGAAGGVNAMMNNALMLLHDEQAAPQFEQMIAQGEEGAATAAVTIGKQVIQAAIERGIEPDMSEASDTIMEVLGDIAEMGIGMGSMPAEPVVNGTPASVYALFAHASDQWAAAFPEFGQALAADVAENATPEDDAAARQVAAYMKQRKQNANQSQTAPGGEAVVGTGGRVAAAPQPSAGTIG